jgi:squalene cyclase
MLPPDQLRETALAIASVQRSDGFIPHTAADAGDTWNHIEAAMGLDAAGLAAEAERAYLWLAGRQRPDGSWAMEYRDGEVSDPAADANFCAYVATGAWHHYLATGDRSFLARLWKTIERALTFTLRLQAPGGEVLWARDAAGRPYPAALLTSSSCIHLSLSCGIAIADTLGRHARDWDAARARLANAVGNRPDAFLPK